MNKLEMQIQSIDVRYDSNPNIMYYNLSCSLLNVYKGRCDLFLVNSNTNLKQELLIKHNRAIMEGNFPQSGIKSNDSHRAMLKNSKKHHAMAPQNHKAQIFAMNLQQTEFTVL